MFSCFWCRNCEENEILCYISGFQTIVLPSVNIKWRIAFITRSPELTYPVAEIGALEYLCEVNCVPTLRTSSTGHRNSTLSDFMVARDYSLAYKFCSFTRGLSRTFVRGYGNEFYIIIYMIFWFISGIWITNNDLENIWTCNNQPHPISVQQI